MAKATSHYPLSTCGLALSLALALTLGRVAKCEDKLLPPQPVDRSPVALALGPDGTWLVTANETSASVSLVDTEKGRVLDEVACGRHPAFISVCHDGQRILVTGAYSGDLTVLKVVAGRLQRIASIEIGFEPTGIAIAPDDSRAYVGLVASGQIAEIDLRNYKVLRRIDVGHWPRYLTLSPDSSRLAVGLSGENKIAVVDTKEGKVLYDEPLVGGINIGHMRTSSDGKYAYFTWMVYRNNPITAGNIRLGWVLASRIGRVRLDGPSYREAISLDVPRKAVADPHGLVISDNQRRMVASASGTHELLVYRLPDLPFIGIGGPGDLIDRKLLADRDLFYRIEVGGRPMGMEIASDNRTVYVANYLKNSVQVVDIEDRKVVREIALGSAEQVSPERRGMAMFYDARHSLDQWYSCHSCHQNGGVNSKAMDTFNDGTARTVKTVLPLHHVTRTKPWTWHGWQENLTDAMHKSFTTTMLGRAPTEAETKSILAYLETLQPPPNPFLKADGSLTESALRGKKVFHSSKAACINCHAPPYFTDGKIHDVGLGKPTDRYQGFNTPSLLGIYRKVRFLHNGRAKSLEEVLTDKHAPSKVQGEADLSAQELEDLVAYLKSL